MHVALEVNSSNNKLATEFTPEELKITKVFTALNPAYNPAEHNGILPKDYSYYPPVQSDTQEDLNNYNQEHGIDLNEEGTNWNDVITDLINPEKKDDKKEEKKNDDNEVKILP